MSLGLQFIQALLSSRNPSPLKDVRDEFFVKQEKVIFKFVKNHLSRHGVLPDSETLLEHNHRLARATEPASYYAGRLRERYLYTLIQERSPEIAASMKAKDVAGALALFREVVSIGGHVLESESFSSIELEARQLLSDYNRVKASGEPDFGITFGWPTLDRMTLGMMGGDLVVIAGRPNVGKSYVMLYMAFKAWEAGKSIGILSMEMPKQQIVRRFVSFITRANPNLIRKGELSTWAEELLRGAVRGFRRRPPVWINSADMKNKSTSLVTKLFEEHCPDVVYVDSAYRLTPTEVRNNMVGHERSAQVVHELKQGAMHYDRPLVAVNQYNRQVKSRGGVQAELGTSAGTDSWEQDSSMFLGIRFGPPPFEESTRVLDLTKNREGPLGSFRCNFGFEPVDLSEIAGDEHFGVGEESEWRE